MKPSEALRETREVLFERGWHKGSLYGPGSSLCLIGAIGVGCVPDGDVIPGVLTALRKAGVFGIPRWNDKPGRTFADVIDALERAEKFALIAEEPDD